MADDHGAVRTRLASAAVLVPLVAAAVFVGGTVWALLLSAIAAAAAGESMWLDRVAGRRPTVAVGLVLAPALTLTGLRSVLNSLRSVLALGVIVALLWQLTRPEDRRSSQDWAATLAGPLYVGLLMGYGVLLRDMEHGLAWTAMLLVLVWSNDSAAYVGGRLFGRTPLFASISPRKTWEGAIAGSLATVAAALALPAVLSAVPGLGTPPDLQLPWLLGVGLAVSIVAPAGDLATSFLKRQAGVKDSGQLIPGHGGLLDRIDSLLLAAPVVYHAALLIAGGP